MVPTKHDFFEGKVDEDVSVAKSFTFLYPHFRRLSISMGRTISFPWRGKKMVRLHREAGLAADVVVAVDEDPTRRPDQTQPRS